MKRIDIGILLGAVGVLGFAMLSRAENLPATGSPPDAPSQPTIIERGADHRVWERTRYERGPEGKLVPRKEQYTELATGMHYQKDGQWVESKAVIELLPDGKGATAQQGRHKVIFPPNLLNGRIELSMADGNWLRSQVLGLSYYDTESGRSVLIAELKSTTGELQKPNVVIYPDAFTDFKADIRYTYTLAGFEQDIILREQPASPKEYGLNPETTRLQVLTEFFDVKQPQQKVREQKNLKDATLDFGAMRMARGKAFAIGDNQRSVSVAKSWNRLDGRDFLTEEVELKKVETQLKELPVSKTAAQHQPSANSALHRVADQRLLPAPRMVKQGDDIFRVADTAVVPTQGLVLDYQILNSGSNNFTFKGDRTYYISADVGLSGTTIIEGGTVIKFATNSSLDISDMVDCRTAPYRPVVFTAKDDNTAGQVISGSTGSPVGYYGSDPYGNTPALRLEGMSSSPAMKYLRFSYLRTAISADVAVDLSDVQIVSCHFAIDLSSGALFSLFNGLVSHVETLVHADENGWVTGTHLTVSECRDIGTDNNSSGTLLFTNCIFADVTNWPAFTHITNTCAVTPGGGVFQTAYGGSFYLAPGSGLLDAGTTDITPNMMARLAQTTVFPPIVFTNATFTNDMTFDPQATRDTNGVPDVGYHYDPIDYVFGGVTNSGGNLTFLPGTVGAWFRTSQSWSHGGHGIFMGDQKTIEFQGLANARCFWVRANTAQEGDNNNTYGIGGITGRASGNATNAPLVTARFCNFSFLGGELTSFMRDDYGHLRVEATHCEFWGGSIGQYASSLHFTNCLFVRDNLALTGNDTNILNFIMRNCTMFGGNLSLEHWSGASWPLSVRNSAFDSITIFTFLNSTTNTSIVDFAYNAYLAGASRLTPTNSHDVLVTNFNWQAAQFGNYYLPDNSPLVDAGDASPTPYLLDFFTMQTNGTPEILGLTNIVDRGYHCPAVNNDGDFIDPDGNGVLDTNLFVLAIFTSQNAQEPVDTTNHFATNGIFSITVTNLFTGSNAPLTQLFVPFSRSGTAIFDTDYTLRDHSTDITNLTDIPTWLLNPTITLFPVFDKLLEEDETATITLLNNTGYFVNPAHASATVIITNAMIFETVGLPGLLDMPMIRPVGIDYSPATNSLILSVNYAFGGGGLPFNFERIGLSACSGMLAAEQWSSVSNRPDEVKIAIVKTNAGGFNAGEMFFGTGINGVVGKLSADGATANLNWATLTTSTTTFETLIRGSLYVDQTGEFGNDLIAVTGNSQIQGGGVWRINSSGTSSPVVILGANIHLEGVITLPNNTNRFGPWAGKMLVGAESFTPPAIFAITTNGIVSTNFLDIQPEDFDIIQTNQDLYCVDTDLGNDFGRIIKLSRTLFTNYWGDLLVTQEGAPSVNTNGLHPARLFILHWDSTNSVFIKRTINYFNGLPFPEFEHVTFAPIDLPIK